MKFLVAVTSLASVALAQYDYGSPASSSGSSTSAAPASTTSSGSSAVHTVKVGAGGLVFSPDTVTAAVGDKVQFVFSGNNHTVTQSTFAKPCNPSANGFFSGFTGSTSTTFSISVTDTNPIWFYCSQITHCQSGMAGVINPPSSGNTLAAYKSSASSAVESSIPSAVAGGVIQTQGGSPSTAPGGAASSATGSTTSSSTSSTASPSGNAADSLSYSSGSFVKAFLGLFGVAALLM